MTNATIAKDPVCGMDVEVTSDTAKTVYLGQTYYFCDTTCKEKFDSEPEAYLGESAGDSTGDSDPVPA